MAPVTEGLILLLNEVLFFAAHVIGQTSFKKPLGAAEEKMYLERCLKGDEEAKRILIERNLRLVAYVVKKYRNAGIDHDDLVSIGTIGLIKAINTFNSRKGTRLAAYAVKCIRNEILMAIRLKPKGEVYLQDAINMDAEGNEILLADMVGTENNIVFDQVELSLLLDRLRKNMDSILNKRERMVLELRYGLLNGEYKTQREIAKLLDISRSYVSRIEKGAVTKLRKAMEKEALI